MKSPAPGPSPPPGGFEINFVIVANTIIGYLYNKIA
jgi:hypothetical protein